MKKYSIDLSGVSDRDGFHCRLRDSIPVPDWYGNNLDALYDVLTQMPAPAQIRISGWQELAEAQPQYFDRIRRVFHDAQKEIPGLEALFQEEPDIKGGRGRTLIITDLHGCLDECRDLLAKMGFDEDTDTLVNLGDTIDRGPKIYETFVYLRDLKERMGDRCILLRGNHEQMMLDAAHTGGRNKELWYYNKGDKTVFSFLHHKDI